MLLPGHRKRAEIQMQDYFRWKLLTKAWADMLQMLKQHIVCSPVPQKIIRIVTLQLTYSLAAPQVNFKLKGYLDILQYRSFRFSALVKKGWQNLSKCLKLKGYLDVLQYQSFRFWALVKKGWQNLWKSLFSWVFHLHG